MCLGYNIYIVYVHKKYWCVFAATFNFPITVIQFDCIALCSVCKMSFLTNISPHNFSFSLI